MKFFTILFASCLFAVSIHAQTYCLQLEELSNDGTTLEVKIKAMGSAAFNIGTSNLKFEFNPAILSTPTLGTSLLNGSFLVHVTSPAPNQASFNIELTTTNDGSSVGTGLTDIGTIIFNITDAAAAPGAMDWVYTGSSTGTVVFLDDDMTFITATSPACLVGLAAPQPVELISFDAQKKNSKAFLTWTTASEINADYFEVQHSGDGRTWEKLTNIKAVGNSFDQQQYFAIHDHPYSGANYYRLKIVDNDRSFAYSELKHLTFGKLENVAIFPNPASNSLTLSYGFDRQLLELTIIDQVGKKVMQIENPTSREINISNLQAGPHFVEFRFKDEILVRKLLIEKGK